MWKNDRKLMKRCCKTSMFSSDVLLTSKYDVQKHTMISNQYAKLVKDFKVRQLNCMFLALDRRKPTCDWRNELKNINIKQWFTLLHFPYHCSRSRSSENAATSDLAERDSFQNMRANHPSSANSSRATKRAMISRSSQKSSQARSVRSTKEYNLVKLVQTNVVISQTQTPEGQ